MYVAEMNELTTRFHLAGARYACPECGARMAEVDRLDNGEGVFVWYRCAKDNCDGQWLKKEKSV